MQIKWSNVSRPSICNISNFKSGVISCSFECSVNECFK